MSINWQSDNLIAFFLSHLHRQSRCWSIEDYMGLSHELFKLNCCFVANSTTTCTDGANSTTKGMIIYDQ